jgi:universal stress protein A
VTTSIRTILVPTDFSPHARAGFEHALELANALSARVVLLHSYGVLVSTAPSQMWVVPPDLVERLQDGARTELEPLVKRAAQAGVPCESRMSGSPAVEAILEAAAALPAQLIVMGTQGNTGLKHLLLGSVAERVVRLAPCPVTTVKAPAD